MATGTDFRASESSHPATSGNGFFDPCPLAVLAENLRDGRWVDLRTEDGLVKRVRIEQIVIRREGEDVLLRQEWVDGDDDEVRRIRRTLTLDAESVRKVLPTNYHIEQVRPHKLVRPDSLAPDLIETEKVVTTVMESAVFLFQAKRDELLRYHSRERWELTNHRHQIVLVIYEMTNLAPVDICKRLGYKSQGAWLTARYKPRSQYGSAEFRASAQNLGKLVDDQLAPKRYRRQTRTPNDYTPVLP